MAGTVIVGSSVGGVNTALALRRQGYSASITVVGAESDWPYDKPPLSKEFLGGDSATGVSLLTKEAVEEGNLVLRLGAPATRVDRASRTVHLADGGLLPYEHVVVATGRRARRGPGAHLPGVLSLRTIRDAEHLRGRLAREGDLVIIGGGFVGMEVASTVQQLGERAVTIVDPLPLPMSESLGHMCASQLWQLHARNGVMSRFGVAVRDVRPAVGRLEVVLDDDATLMADTVVVGIGTLPEVEWLEGSGLADSSGVPCDMYLRSIADPRVFAVGDVARWPDAKSGRLRHAEHWTNAVEQAECVAFNIANPGDLQRYLPSGYFWTDQYDWHLQVLGDISGLSSPQVPVQPVHLDGTAFATVSEDTSGVAVGVVVANWPRAVSLCRRSLRSGVTAAELREALVGLVSR